MAERVLVPLRCRSNMARLLMKDLPALLQWQHGLRNTALITSTIFVSVKGWCGSVRMEEEPEASTADRVNRARKKSSSLESGGLSHSTLAYDRSFICSASGLLMFAETVCGLLVWTLLGGTEYVHVPGLGWVMFVSVVCWVLTLCLFILYLTTAYTKIPQIPWTLLGLCFNSSAAVLYMTAAVINAASLTQAIRGRYYYISWMASTVFAFVVVLCYTANAYVSYRSWRSKSEDA